MTAEEYARLVKEMRRAQKRWFAGDKSREALDESRRLERAVDKATEEILAGPSLF